MAQSLLSDKVPFVQADTVHSVVNAVICTLDTVGSGVAAEWLSLPAVKALSVMSSVVSGLLLCWFGCK